MSDVMQLLAATRMNDKATRQQAEAEIDRLVQNYGGDFLTTLIGVAGNANSDVSDSQSALLILKNCVVKYWSPGFEQFTGPPLDHETRQRVRADLLQLLGIATNHKVRNACALVIARIGSLEYPEQWPNLVRQTIEYLNSDIDSTAVLGGLVLFKELLFETLREEDFMEYGENVLQRLLEICEAPNKDGRRLMAVQCFHECITFLLMGDDDQLPQLEDVAARFIPKWCALFSILLQEEAGDSELIAEIVGAVREVDSAFPQILEPQLPQLFFVSQGALVSHMSTLDDEVKSNYASLLDIALQNTNARKECLNSGPRIDEFSTLLLNLSVISDELADWWVDDYNEFVTAELELNTGELNPRNNAASLVAMTGQPAILPRLLDLLSTAIMEKSSPQFEESCLYLISNLLSQVDINKHLVVVDFTKFQQFLSALEFTPDYSQQSDPQTQLLVARKISTAALVAKYGGSYIPDPVKFQLATHAFRSPISDSLVVRVSQLRAISMGASLYPEAFKPYQTESLKILASVIDSAEDDTPTFLAEVFGSILKVDYEVVAREGNVIDMLFSLASKDTADIELNAQILDVIGELLDTVSSRSVVDHILKPVSLTIQNCSASGFEYSGDLYFSLDLATAVFEHEGIDFSTEEREQMLQSLYQVITVTEDAQILQVASFAYAALVQNIHTKISPEVANNVLKVAAQLLNPSLADSAALASGKLVNAIIDQFGEELGDMLTELIDASAKRLASAENALLIETLVLVFCDLTLRNANAVVDILYKSGMLEAVMKQWMPAFEVVRGADEINKNIRALQLLFELNDPRLSNLLLNDEPIRNPNEILTRRKAKNVKFTQVPLPLKILKLLIRELLQAPRPPAFGDGNKGAASLGNGEFSDDEWDDELALDDDGAVLDYRTFTLILDWFKKISQQPATIEWLRKLNANEQQALAELMSA